MMKQENKMAGAIPHPKLFYIQNPAKEMKTNFRQNFSDLTSETEYTTFNGDFYCCVRPLLRFGRILGIIPISGLWNDSSNVGTLHFKWNSIAAISSIGVTTVLSINVIFSFLSLLRRFAGSGGGNATELAFSAKGPLFYLTVQLIYLFFLLKANKLIVLFTTWRKVSSALKLKELDVKLFKNICLLACAVYASAFVETLISNLTMFPVETKLERNETVGVTPLETYYLRSNPFWAFIIPFHPLVAVGLLICNLISVQAWNFADVIIIVFSRALYFKFKVLVEQTEKRLMPTEEKHAFQKLDGITWAEVRRDHLTLCKLLDDFEVFLSPLIFLSYSINIFFVCLQLHQGLTPAIDRTLLDSMSSAWSFFHLIFRIIAMSLTASKINEHAHQISNSIQKCSSSEYCKEVERLERMLGTGPLGLSGLGCFVITRAFILVVISVIFTMEIVLLQTSANGSVNSAVVNSTNETLTKVG